jgi:hypothetical protein
MAQLTSEQLSFIASQAIPISKFFDASGLSKDERVRVMDVLGSVFYYGGAACKSGGHTLRTKSGHCIQCDTSKIAYQMRSTASGYVYLAQSPSTNLIKIGYSKLHPQDRGEFLRREAYGGIKDWDIKRICHVEKDAGRREFLVHAALSSFNKNVAYEKYRGSNVECREIFSCDLDHALSKFNELVEPK